MDNQYPPELDYLELIALATEGGYVSTPNLSQSSSVFILSILNFAKQRKFWQNRLLPITDGQWDLVMQTIEIAEAEIMENFLVGAIVAMATPTTPDGMLAMNGQSVPIDDYPDLADRVPTTWIVGDDIVLPDMDGSGVHGVEGTGLPGAFIGENATTLIESNLPPHTHIVDPHNHGYDANAVSPALGGEIPGTASLVTPIPGFTTNINPSTDGGNGTSEPFTNIPKSLTVFWYIVAR